MPLIPGLGRGKGRLISDRIQSRLPRESSRPLKAGISRLGWWRSNSTPEACYEQFNRERVLFHTTEQGSRQLAEHSLWRTVPVGSSLQAMDTRRRELQWTFFYNGHSSHTLSTFPLRSGRNGVIYMNLVREGTAISPQNWGMASSHQQHTSI